MSSELNLPHGIIYHGIIYHIKFTSWYYIPWTTYHTTVSCCYYFADSFFCSHFGAVVMELLHWWMTFTHFLQNLSRTVFVNHECVAALCIEQPKNRIGNMMCWWSSTWFIECGDRLTLIVAPMRIHMDSRRRNSSTVAVATLTASSNQVHVDVRGVSQKTTGTVKRTHGDSGIRRRNTHAHLLMP